MTQNFDRFSDSYSETLNRSLAVTPGMDTDFFDGIKVDCLRTLYPEGVPLPARILDYGCGAGSISVRLAGNFSGSQVDGYDISESMIRLNREKYATVKNLSFTGALPPVEVSYDLVLMANVLHHVAVEKRTDELRRIGSLLSRRGRLCIVEHNPLNPLARWIVSRCAFDEGVSLVWPSALRAQAQAAQLRVDACRYILHVPLKGQWFRNVERVLEMVPTGAQYLMVLSGAQLEGIS